MLVLLEAQEGNWDEIDLMVRAFQGRDLALRYAEVPVVVAPAGLTLGGGCEIVVHGDRVQAAAETYIGLVEVGVGLIPAGGGTKEMLARAMRGAPARGDLLPFVQRAFETIAFATVSTSAATRGSSDIFGESMTCHDEPGAADGRCQGAGARPRARRLPAAAAASRSRSAAKALRRRSSSACIWPGAPAASPTTTR